MLRPGSAASSIISNVRLEVAHDGVPDVLDAGAVDPHVVRRPPGAELVAARRQLADEVGQPAVVRVSAGLGTEDRHGVVRGALPVARRSRGIAG